MKRMLAIAVMVFFLVPVCMAKSEKEIANEYSKVMPQISEATKQKKSKIIFERVIDGEVLEMIQDDVYIYCICTDFKRQKTIIHFKDNNITCCPKR